MFTDVQLPVGQGWGWGRGEASIPPAAPIPLTLPYTLLYCTSVQFTNFVRELLVNIASDGSHRLWLYRGHRADFTVPCVHICICSAVLFFLAWWCFFLDRNVYCLWHAAADFKEPAYFLHRSSQNVRELEAFRLLFLAKSAVKNSSCLWSIFIPYDRFQIAPLLSFNLKHHPFNEVIIFTWRTFTVRENQEVSKAFCLVVGIRNGFTCILFYTGLKVFIAYLCRYAKTLVSVGVCIVRMHIIPPSLWRHVILLRGMRALLVAHYFYKTNSYFKFGTADKHV